MTNEKNDIKKERVGIYSAVGKRIFDASAAYILLLFLYIPMMIISVAIKLSSSGTVIFRQVRVGIDGRSFVCYKFRTMRSDAPPNMPTSSFSDADEYITPIGRFLRRTSLDELPQLFNVLAGDMSIVGPRPLIREETDMHLMRHELGADSLRPGITGLAQIRGRDMISDGEKAGYDGEYASDISFAGDIKIIAGTFFKILSAEGVKQVGGERSVEQQRLDKML